MLVVSPLVTAFKDGSAHVHAKNSRHQHHISLAYEHSSTLSLIAHHQFITPPQKLTIADLAIIFCCAGFLIFIITNLKALVICWPVRYSVLAPPGHLYLQNRTLLI
jgi:hypothetical protein